jgi:hypothetical protein
MIEGLKREELIREMKEKLNRVKNLRRILKSGTS